MAFAVTRLRAAACSGLAVATLLSISPAASAATAAPLDAPTSAATDLVPASVGLTMTGPATDFLPSIFSPVDLPADVFPVAEQTAFSALDLTTTPALVSTSLAARVIAMAKSHLGARYAFGMQGPRSFDCVGLVLRAYAQAGVISRLGGWSNRSGYALLSYGRRHHLVSTSNGQPGDVVVWGGGGHVGIYLGHGMAISALVSGVRIHGIYAVTKRFTAFIHTGLSQSLVSAVTTVATKSIGTRFAGPSLQLRTSHDTTARAVSTLRAGTRLTLLRIWKDPKGRTWYRVNANTHVGWVAGWLTRTS